MTNDPLDNPRYKAHFRAVHETMSEIATLSEPYWKARDDIAKTIISLSAGIITLTATFAGSISLSVPPYLRYMTCAAWVLLFFSITTAIAGLWVSQQARKLGFTFFTRKPFMEATRPESQQLTDAEFKEVRNELENRITPLTRKDNWAGYFHRASFVLFALALLCIGFVGTTRMFP